MKKYFQIGLIALFAFSAQISMGHTTEDGSSDDYPTSAKVDYVLACMAANGETIQNLHRCSCSIDMIASQLSYEEYVQADTVLQIQHSHGQRGIFFREGSWAKAITDKLERAQAVSTLECF